MTKNRVYSRKAVKTKTMPNMDHMLARATEAKVDILAACFVAQLQVQGTRGDEDIKIPLRNGRALFRAQHLGAESERV